MADARVEHIFRVSDRNRDGCLDKAEFTELVKVFNPEVSLSEGQLGLIQEEVWCTFPKYVDREGLTFEGLKELYCDGFADLDHDYDALILAHRGPAREQAEQPAAVEHVSGGRLGMAAVRNRQPALADASPAPSTPGDVFAGLASPAPPAAAAADADIFAFLQTPAPAAAPPETAPKETLPTHSLAFAVRLPQVRTEGELDARGLRAELVAALDQSLPEGSAARISTVATTPHGLAVGLVCEMPGAVADGEEAQYFQTVLHADPHQVFTASIFGHVDVLLGSEDAAGDAAAAATAAADAAAAVALAGTSGKAALGFTVRLPGIEERAFRRAGAGLFISELRDRMPAGTVGRITKVTAAPQGVMVTVGAATPAEGLPELQQFHRALRQGAAAVFSHRSFGAAELVASQLPAAARPALGVQVRLPGQKKAAAADGAAQKREAALALSLERYLPEGSSGAVTCVEDTHLGLVITLAASLPPGTDPEATQRAEKRVEQVDAWVPVAVVAVASGIRGRPPECIKVGSTIETAFGLPAEAAFQFGLAGGRYDARSPTPVRSRSRSASPTKASPPKSPGLGLFSRLFTRTKGAAAASPGLPLPPSAAAAAAGAVPAERPASPPQGAMIAGYQRRASSSGGSGGLVEAMGDLLEECSINDVDAQLAHTAAAALAAAEAFGGDKVPPSPGRVFRVTAYVPAEEEGAHATPAVAEVPPPAQQQRGAFKTPTKLRPAALTIPAADDPFPSVSGPKAEAHLLSPEPAGIKAKAEAGAEQRQTIASVPAREGAAAAGAAAAVGSGMEQAPTPWEAHKAADPRGWRDADARVTKMLGKVASIVGNPRCGTAEVAAVQDAAGLLPAWARHQAHMQIGEKLSQARLYPEALRSFREAVAADPADPLAHFRQGNAHFALHQYHDASRAYFSALQRCPECDPLRVKVHINMGISLESDGRVESAAREYGKAAAAAPEHPRAHKLLGSAKCALGDFEGAVAALTTALEINPGFADAWGDLGCSYVALGDVDNGHRCLVQAIEHDPAHLEARFNMGNLMRQCHDFEEAVACYDAVLAQDATHWRSLLNKAVVQTCTGRGAEAAGNLKAALQLSGRGSVLAGEVERLQALLAANADWEALRQQMSCIDGTAKKVAEGTLAEDSHNEGLAALSARSSAGGGARSATPSVRSVARSTRSVGTHSVHSVLSPRRAAPSMSPTKTPERILTWLPPAHVAASDIGEEVGAKLGGLGLSAGQVLSQLDLPLLQRLQPATCVTAEEIWAEARVAGEALASPVKSSRDGRGHGIGSGTSWQGRASSKVVPAAAAEAVLRRLLRRAPPHLAQPLMSALLTSVLPLLDFQGTGHVDLALLLAVMAALLDAPARDRLELSYKLLMWRSSERPGSKENPVTRKELVGLLSALKVVFEREHNTTYLAARPSRPADAQYVLYERFCSDILKHFPHYQALPLQCNPLS